MRSALPAEIPDHLRGLAVPLDDEESAFVWAPADALAVIESLRSTRIALPSGEIYRREPWGFVQTYDDWTCEPAMAEGPLAYAQRTREVATQAIELHGEDSPGDVCFLLEFSDQEDAA
jgi:hypothetical protein